MTLEDIYNSLPLDSEDIKEIPSNIQKHIAIIAQNCNKQKGVYTVLTTLLFYKKIHPEQDIRNHQDQIEKGFSGRSFDTKNITPILKKLKLPSMAESGWLTRSLEQPYPYNLEYPGKISGGVKTPFLETLDYVEKNPDKAELLLKLLLTKVKEEVEKQKVEIKPLENAENLTIDKIVEGLEVHFSTKYGTHNGAKLPVLAFYAIYLSIIKEVQRYNDCELMPLASLTACDLTSKASGDIEIFKDKNLFEAIEIKLDKQIDSTIVRVVEEKIYKYNPERYYILSYFGIKEEDKEEINKIVSEVKKNHGCTIIINGLIATIKYYLRLITSLKTFIEDYSRLVENDHELQKVHKETWNDIMTQIINK